MLGYSKNNQGRDEKRPVLWDPAASRGQEGGAREGGGDLELMSSRRPTHGVLTALCVLDLSGRTQAAKIL